MSAAVDLVARHLAALWRYDWAELGRSLSPEAKLQISSGDWTHSDWEIGGFYRHISRAWDFSPRDTQLFESEGGIVQAKISLTNGADWAKDIAAEYSVNASHIESIQVIEGVPYRLSDGPAALS